MDSKTFRFTGKKPASGGRDVGGMRDDYVAGVPLARVIPRMLDERVDAVMLTQPKSIAAERFRRLASMLSTRSDGPQVLVVTSAIPNEGKTTLAMNLAMAWAVDPDHETLIVDADLRRPTVHTWLKQPPGLGLADVLQGTVGLEHAIHDLKNSPLKVLPAGGACTDPIELLASEDMRQVLAQLREHYRHIVIDTPPIVPFTDADAIAKCADGVLLAARAGVTPRAAYQQAVALVQSAPILGVVLNEAGANFADGAAVEVGYYNEYYDRGRR